MMKIESYQVERSYRAQDRGAWLVVASLADGEGRIAGDEGHDLAARRGLFSTRRAALAWIESDAKARGGLVSARPCALCDGRGRVTVARLRHGETVTKRKRCEACAGRGAKPGPGRPPLNEGGGITTPHRIRLGAAHVAELESIVADGHAKTTSEAMRYLIEQSAARR